MLPEVVLHDTERSALVLIFSIAADALASCMSAPKAVVDEVIDVRCVFSNNTIYLPVMINGQGGFFMTLDTGTNPSALDVGKAKPLGLPISAETSEAKGLGNGAVTTHSSSSLMIWPRVGSFPRCGCGNWTGRQSSHLLGRATDVRVLPIDICRHPVQSFCAILISDVRAQTF